MTGIFYVLKRGWNGYRNKSQNRKLALQKEILPPLLRGFEPATFQYLCPALCGRAVGGAHDAVIAGEAGTVVKLELFIALFLN